MLCEFTVNQIHKKNFEKKKKTLDVSELSPNVNSLDIDKKKTLAENLTEKLVLFSAIIDEGFVFSMTAEEERWCVGSAVRGGAGGA